MKRAAAILIIEKGLILAVARKNNPNDFGLPGGKCEEGESFEDAALRELFEETGIKAYDTHLVFERNVPGEEDYITRTFMVEKYYGEVPSDEDQKKKGEGRVKWVTPEELIAGCFGQYNTNLLKTLGIIK